MKQNVGGVDRMLRITVGVGLLVWGISTGNQWGYIGLIPLFTGLTRWCPAYCPLGFSTAVGACCKTEGGCTKPKAE